MSESEKEQKTALSLDHASAANVSPEDLEIPDVLPVLPLRGFVFFPGMGFPLQVANESSKQLIDEAILKERLLVLVGQLEKP